MSKEIEWEGMVVVTTMHGEKLLGWIPEGMEREDWEKEADESLTRSTGLRNVRTMLARVTQVKSNNSRSGALAVFLALMSIDAFTGPATTMRIRASTWYFPIDNPVCKNQFEALINQAEEHETISRANAAGLHTAGTIPSAGH